MRSFRSDNESSAADRASSDAVGSPGKQTLIDQLDQQDAPAAGSPASTPSGTSGAAGIERAEQRLARPGYNYLAPFARPLIAEARKPGVDPAPTLVRLDQLFGVSKSDGGGDLAPVKAASNAYHAQLGEQAMAELSAKPLHGAAPAVRTELAAAGHSLAAKYTPKLEDGVQLQVQLGQIAATGGTGRVPAISIDLSIRPNDYGCLAWLTCDTFTGLWRRLTGGATPNDASNHGARDERAPLLADAQPAPHHMDVPAERSAAPSVSPIGPPATHDAAVPGQANAPHAPGAPEPVAPAEPTAAAEFVARFDAKGAPTAHRVDRVAITAPSKGMDQAESGPKQPGYVVNMATTPGEVGANMASRYFEGERAQDSARTAVVVGVNSFLGMDAGADGQKANAVEGGIGKVTAPADGQMAVFGFTWDPGWHMDGQPAPLTHVRQHWRALPPDVRTEASTLMDTVVKNTLPYGFFRNQVLNSEHTRHAVTSVGKVADPVHIVVQDADGGVASHGGKHVLSAYDDVLRDMARQPLLTIGGYHFTGYEWPADSTTRTQRLTELSNEIDRAIRVAIATVYPEMLYPTEPNMLIKAKDQQHHDGVFDRHIEGDLFGTGASEGRTARQNILAANKTSDAKHGAPVTYAPSTSTMTSPVPERPERGLTVPATAEYMEKVESGQLYQERTGAKTVKDDKKYPSLMVEEQSQNPLAPRRLNQEFVAAYEGTDAKIPSAAKRKVKDAFEAPAATAQQLVSPAPDGSGEASSGPSGPSTQPANATKAKKANAVDPAVTRAQAVTTAIVTAMSGEQMQHIWQELRQILEQLQREAAAKREAAPKDEHERA